MKHSVTSHRSLYSSLLLSSAFALAVACGAPPEDGVRDGEGAGAGTGAGAATGNGTGGGGGLNVGNSGTGAQPGEGNVRCDATGNCNFCIAVLVLGTADSAADDANASAFRDWLNNKSNAVVTVMDPKDPVTPTPKPTLTAEFLANYDVIILQLQGDSKTGPFWTYTADEIAALKAWVEAGNGLISLTGYNGNVAAQEAAASNQLLSAVAGLSYGTTDIATTGVYCTNNSYQVNQWVDQPDQPISYEVSAVGAFHGYPVVGGTPVASAGGTTIGAVTPVGAGYVFAWGDEWVIFTNQWQAANPNDGIYTDPNNPCYNQRPEQVFQLPQFWYNALTYASQGEQCVVKIDEPTVILR